MAYLGYSQNISFASACVLAWGWEENKYYNVYMWRERAIYGFII